MFKRFAVLSAGLSLALATPAFSETAIQRVNNEVGLALIGTNIDYLETDSTGAPLDGNKGNPLGGYAWTSAMINHGGVEDFYAYAGFTIEGIHTQYTGALQGGHYGDIVDDQGTLLMGQDFRFGKGFALGDHLMLTPYLGVGAHEWSRTMTGPFGYDEFYSHAYVGAGAMAQVSLANVVLSAHGLLGTTFASHMASVDYSGGANVPPGQFYLGNDLIEMAGVDADIAFGRRWHATAGFDFTHFKYGVSPPTQYGYYEPNSETTEYSAKLGLGYSF